MSDFEIRRGGGDHRHRQTGDLTQTRLIGDDLPGAGSHGPAQRFQAECLRRLRGPQPGAIDRPGDGALSHPLQGVGDGGCRDRRATLRGGSHTAIEELRLGQRARAVVDDHDLDSLRQRGQSRVHGVLPPLTAGDDSLHLGKALVADEPGSPRPRYGTRQRPRPDRWSRHAPAHRATRPASAGRPGEAAPSPAREGADHVRRPPPPRLLAPEGARMSYQLLIPVSRLGGRGGAGGVRASPQRALPP